MKSLFFALLFPCIFFFTTCAQVPEVRPVVENDQFDQRLSGLLNFTVPIIGVAELAETKDQYVILDTREPEEFALSHIEGAQYLGYKQLNESVLAELDKDSPIVLYCSVGYRSEKIGERLQKKGFTKVYNLYGSIFEWVNQGHPVVDNAGYPTDKVHTYNKKWSKWVEEGKATKVW